MTIRLLQATEAAARLDELFEVLWGCVTEGASIGFTERDNPQPVRHFWQQQLPALAAGDKHLLVAEQEGKVVATVMLVTAMPPNGLHRAEVCKLLVHPTARRTGLARQLMQRVEALAQSLQRELLVLDTRVGDAASALYDSLGWQESGIIPAYALSVTGERDATRIMYKMLPPLEANAG